MIEMRLVDHRVCVMLCGMQVSLILMRWNHPDRPMAIDYSENSRKEGRNRMLQLKTRSLYHVGVSRRELLV